MEHSGHLRKRTDFKSKKKEKKNFCKVFLVEKRVNFGTEKRLFQTIPVRKLVSQCTPSWIVYLLSTEVSWSLNPFTGRDFGGLHWFLRRKNDSYLLSQIKLLQKKNCVFCWRAFWGHQQQHQGHYPLQTGPFIEFISFSSNFCRRGWTHVLLSLF